MEKNYKTGMLLAACVITVLTLCFIQFYLVKNTYRLTRDNYYTEVRRSVSQITGEPFMQAMQDSAHENIKKLASQYQGGRLSRAAFFARLKAGNQDANLQFIHRLNDAFQKDPGLKGVRYMSRYEELITDHSGRQDTLLSASDVPIVMAGVGIPMTDAILLNKNLTVARTNKVRDRNGKKTSKPSIGIVIRQSDYIDITSKKTEIFRRMTGIFLGAAGLIAAVIILFYLIFHALIRQKKIAQIKTDFANNVTHELKTPLASAGLVLKSLRHPSVQSKPKMMQDLLASLDRQHQKIQQLVDHVLQSSMEADSSAKMQEVEITDFLHQYVADLVLAEHPVMVEIEPCRQKLVTDPALLERMLNILVDNAAKYSEAGKCLMLKAFVKDQFYRIQVKDQGPGLPKGQHVLIFDKFYRLPEQQNRHTIKGLGLGLFLAKQAAAQLGARLNLNSIPGQGCTFIIELPL